MINHVVMWKLKEESMGNKMDKNAQLIKEKLTALIGKIPELGYMEVGINYNDTKAAYDLVLITKFENQENLQSYATNPLHLEVVSFITEVSASRIVVDYRD